MPFYTYDYLESRTHSVNLGHWILIFAALIFLLIFAVLWIRKKLDYRYREVGLLILIILLLSVGVQVNSYNNSKSSDNQYSQMSAFITDIAKTLNANKEKILVNRTNVAENPIIKIEDEFYLIQFNDDKTKYLITEATIKNPDAITVIDVEGGN